MSCGGLEALQTGRWSSLFMYGLKSCFRLGLLGFLRSQAQTYIGSCPALFRGAEFNSVLRSLSGRKIHSRSTSYTRIQRLSNLYPLTLEILRAYVA